MKEVTGLYIPTEEEEYNCRTGHSSCEYGICSECSVGYSDREDNEGEEEKV